MTLLNTVPKSCGSLLLFGLHIWTSHLLLAHQKHVLFSQNLCFQNTWNNILQSLWIKLHPILIIELPRNAVFPCHLAYYFHWLICNKQDTVLPKMLQGWNYCSGKIHICLKLRKVGLRIIQGAECEEQYLAMSKGRHIFVNLYLG